MQLSWSLSEGLYSGGAIRPRAAAASSCNATQQRTALEKSQQRSTEPGGFADMQWFLQDL